MNKFTAQKRLSIVWIVLTFLIAALLFVMSLNNKFEGNDKEAWKWFSQFCVPGITLMLTTFVAISQKANDQAPNIDLFFYKLTMAISLFYLLSLLVTLLYVPFTSSAIALFARSNVFLTIFQGISMSALALFFVKGN
jgi:hypothetical protein